MTVPIREHALALLHEAEQLNPGPWVAHSIYVAQAAEAIAAYHPQLDAEKAFVLGVLHDIGRRAGVTKARHILDGYHFLQGLGFDEAARICLTHSFPVQCAAAMTGGWDCSTEEVAWVDAYLKGIEYTTYDRLLQLCDALALSTGFCLLEKRFVDVAIRYGTDPFTIQRWQIWLQLKETFEAEMSLPDHSIYSLLPGVIENTFRAES